MPFYTTPGGSILEIDLPVDPMRLEIHEAAIARDDLVEVDEALVERYQDGPGEKLRLVAEPEAEPEPAGKKGRKATTED